MPGESIHVELSRLARGDQPYWRYKGSLTTPRCSDVVEWIVIAEPLVIGLDTFRSMQGAKLDVGFANARHLVGRQVCTKRASQKDLKPNPDGTTTDHEDERTPAILGRYSQVG